MGYKLENEFVSYALDERGAVRSVKNLAVGREYCTAPGETFRLIYQIEDFEERSVNASEQKAPRLFAEGNRMTVEYDELVTPDGVLPIYLKFELTLEERRLTVVSFVENRCPSVRVMELQTTFLAGIGGEGEEAREDRLLVPDYMGRKIADPYHEDLFLYAKMFKKKYERPDQRHSDLDLPYPGFTCMQWFTLYNDSSSIYVGNHDAEHRILSQHIERRCSDNTLRLGICQYPFLEEGEKYETPPVVYAFLEGDWHGGSKLYRKWMDEVCGWKPPQRPQWAQEFQGWLRCIFRTQSGEFNFRFTDIPRMFDQVQAAGLNTLFVLGWPKGGFGRLRPDYYLDPRYEEDFKKGVEYVHSKGGKLLMYVSYFAVDEHSRYFREEGGEETLTRDIWGSYTRFSETYAMDGTYRKLINNPRNQLCTCSGSDKWHEKMKESADYCLNLGADGVLYDLGGFRPLFCTAKGHDHEKPNQARASKARRYKELRKNVKEKGEEKIILMEHVIDIYSQSMDIAQGSVFAPRKKDMMPEMYRYTFPEIIMTNRNNALDEVGYLDNCNFSFMMNLAFDLSIFRCAGLPEDIPNYTAYMKRLIRLRSDYKKYFNYGTFVDQDGFETEGTAFRQMGYLASDGSLGVAVWNASDKTATQAYTNKATGKSVSVTLEKDTVTFVEL